MPASIQTAHEDFACLRVEAQVQSPGATQARGSYGEPFFAQDTQGCIAILVSDGESGTAIESLQHVGAAEQFYGNGVSGNAESVEAGSKFPDCEVNVVAGLSWAEASCGSARALRQHGVTKGANAAVCGQESYGHA
jgi:hypothetical protein